MWACHVTHYHSKVKNKVVANLTVRIEFTYGSTDQGLDIFLLRERDVAYCLIQAC